MSEAVLCPVCGGSGKVPVPSLFPEITSTTGEPTIITCHGCCGLGWVKVE